MLFSHNKYWCCIPCWLVLVCYSRHRALFHCRYAKPYVCDYCFASFQPLLGRSALTVLHICCYTARLAAVHVCSHCHMQRDWSKTWLDASASMLISSQHLPTPCTRPDLPVKAVWQSILSVCCQHIPHECRYKARHAFISCGITVVHLEQWCYSIYKK